MDIYLLPTKCRYSNPKAVQNYKSSVLFNARLFHLRKLDRYGLKACSRLERHSKTADQETPENLVGDVDTEERLS